jgi:glycosyltransferase involved in cell wall biosynthesis
MKQVFLNWQLNNSFGWGILGFNIFLQWANDEQIRPLMGAQIGDNDLAMTDPLRLLRAMPAIIASNQFRAAMKPLPDGSARIDAFVVQALGNGFAGSPVYGRVNVGRCVFENTQLQGAAESLKKYDELLTASTWNAELLVAATGRRPKVIFEGVDISVFCPGPKSGLMDPSRFYIFSGGKIEFRKGQDLVLLAFKQFSRMHPDAVLVTAWHSPWPKVSAGFSGRLERPLQVGANGELDIYRWVADNGIDAGKVMDLGRLPNPLVPLVLREMDICLQPSRAEACTNLPVKEAMATGIPVIAGINTGVRDLLTEENCLLLTRQTAVAPHKEGWATDGWGESDVDEIVSCLEYGYTHREKARELGAASRRWLIDHGRTWQRHAASLKDWLLSLPY